MKFKIGDKVRIKEGNWRSPVYKVLSWAFNADTMMYFLDTIDSGKIWRKENVLELVDDEPEESNMEKWIEEKINNKKMEKIEKFKSFNVKENYDLYNQIKTEYGELIVENNITEVSIDSQDYDTILEIQDTYGGTIRESKDVYTLTIKKD